MLHCKTNGIKVFLFALLLPFFSFSQQLSPEDALQRYAKYPAERIFVQFDKQEYMAGEILHFKAWVFAKSSPSYISTNLYVELLDQQKKTVYSAVVPLVGGVGDGSFAMAKDLPENIYYFRAYTSWQLNFTESCQFIQPVVVYNPSSSMRVAAPAAAWQASLHPESGVLLDGIESDVAVRLHSFSRLRAQWSGYVFENADTTNKLSEFQSLNEEVGLFTFTPYYGKKYSVKITDENGSTAVLPLQEMQQQGASLKTVNLSEGIGFRISSKGLPAQLKGFKITAHLADGTLLYSATIQSSKGEVNGLIPVDAAIKGLVHITIFDAGGNAMAERLCFANLQHAALKTPDVQYNRFSAEPKKLNEWNAMVDTLRTDSYAVLVEDAWEPVTSGTKNFLAAYWLYALSSQPQKTGWYFDGENKAGATALDALLVSEKWSLFNWGTLLQNTGATMRYFPDNYLTYRGAVTVKGKPVVNEKVTLLFQLKDSSRILTDVNTDSAGMLVLKSLYFFDTAKVFYHLTNNKNTPVKIDVDFKLISSFAAYNSPLPQTGFTMVPRTKSDTMPQRMKEYIMAMKHIQSIADGFKTMDEVLVKTALRTKSEQLNRKLSSPMFQSPGEAVFDFVNEDQDLGGSTILEWLGSRVAGATPEPGGEISIRGQRPQVYIDEFLDNGEPSMLNSIPVSNIAMVKVIKNSYLIGAGGAPVIAVYTKRGEMFPQTALRKPNVTAKIVAGYSMPEAFKPLSYGKGMTVKTGYDTRSLLYWNTALTAEKGKAVIEFYNNDISKKLHLVVIGFSNGQPVYLDKVVTLQ